jgi:predicted nucleic acid-binding protein
MIVVSDTTPINILAQIGLLDLLPSLFGSVIITPAVASELSHEHTPEAVRVFFNSPPNWISVRAPEKLLDTRLPRGAGEKEAISLAVELHADFLLADDWRARQTAKRLGLTVMGTVGLLGQAAKKGLIDLEHAVTKLQTTNFHLTDELLDIIRKDQGR